MRLTTEQQAIITSLKLYNNIKVFAYAGTGKTTTLKMLTESYPKLKFLYLAFNNSIANEAKTKFSSNTHIRTNHSLAFNLIKNDLDMSNLVNKYRPLDLMDIYEYIPNYQVAKLILDCFNGYCYSNITDISEENIFSIINRNKDRKILYYTLRRSYNYLLSLITDIVKDMWNKMLDGYLKFTHDFYLKYFQLNLNKYKSRLKFDCVLLDEAQDTNDVVLNIFENIQANKKIIVGDVYQKIYGFRGSINAMEKFSADIQLHLSTTFRFNENIAKQANLILSNIRKEKVFIKAMPSHKDNSINNIAILSRTNSGLIEIADQLISNGKAFNTIRPVEEITRLPLSVLDFICGSDNIKEKWLSRFNDIEELQEFAKEINDVELLSAINIAMEYKKDLYKIVDTMKRMEKLNTNMFLSTTHTAKGLEWDKVVILDNFPDIIDLFVENKINTLKEFNYLVKQEDEKALQIAEEINLIYVAITRAKKELENKTINMQYFTLSEEDFNKEISDRTLVSKKTWANPG